MNLRRHLLAALAAAVIFGGLGIIGNMDYADALDVDAQEKLARIARARQLQEVDKAKIWSWRCVRKGKQHIATKADNQPWKGGCVDADLRV